jgi:hypothetical protein
MSALASHRPQSAIRSLDIPSTANDTLQDATSVVENHWLRERGGSQDEVPFDFDFDWSLLPG